MSVAHGPLEMIRDLLGLAAVFASAGNGVGVRRGACKLAGGEGSVQLDGVGQHLTHQRTQSLGGGVAKLFHHMCA